jgi:Mn-containing catalase
VIRYGSCAFFIYIIGEIFSGQTPSRNGGELRVIQPPEGFPVPMMPELADEHIPGITYMNREG